MNLTFREAKITFDKGVWLCIKVSEPAPVREFLKNMKDRVYECTVKEFRKKRSLDANAYMWELLNQMASVLGAKKEELYLEKVKNYGIYKDFTLRPEDAPTFQIAWSKLGTGWPTEQVDFTPDGENVIVRAYYGSSQYNTKQMARLIDAVVEDCKSLEIETLPPDKLAAMKEEWRGQHTAKQ